MDIPNGKYRAKAKAWLLTEIGERSTPAVSVEFSFLAPEYASEGIAWDGWLTENAYARTVESLRHCGWEGDDVTDLQGLDANEVELVVEAEEYEGKTYPRVKWVNRLGGIATKPPMSADRTKAFAAEMRAKIRALDAAGGRKPAPKAAQRPEPPPMTDEDLPF